MHPRFAFVSLAGAISVASNDAGETGKGQGKEEQNQPYQNGGTDTGGNDAHSQK